MMSDERTRSGAIQLSIASLVIAVVWLCVLPRIAGLPSVQDRVERFRQAGINPTAVFYSDHPEMANIERTIASYVDNSRGSFWIPGSRP